MRLHIDKKGLRALGIAESFQKGKSEKSVLGGVVMRGDMQIDGFGIGSVAVGGSDATEGVIGLYRGLKRGDINLVLLNGCVISWFNIIDVEKVFKSLGIPVICVTYEESEGLEKYLKEYFEDWEKRVKMYRKLGSRTRIKLKTGHEIMVRFKGIEKEKEVKAVLDKFTLQGAVPEPLKVARLLAREVMRVAEGKGSAKGSVEGAV